MKILVELFVSFFKTGLFTFGGGYAVLPMLKSEIVSKHKWLNEDELLNYFSISECSPGIIAVNMAIFCGYKMQKLLGALTAVVAVILPSFILVLLVAGVFSNIVKYPPVEHALNGIRLGVAAMLIKVVYDTGKKVYQNQNNFGKIFLLLIFSVALCGLLFFKLSAMIVVVCSMLAGCVLLWVKRARK